MIDKPEDEDRRSPKFLIMDTTPLSLLGAINALDWLFVPGCEVWMTDMIMEEATRDPGEGRDRRRNTRTSIAAWIGKNRYRIRRVATPEGERYRREMTLWDRAGSPPELRPDWADRGEASVLGVVKMARTALERDEAIVALVDDRDARAALRVVRADIDMMGTQTFIRWVAEDFGVAEAEAETAWDTILMATDGLADPGEDEDPVYIRKRP